MTRPLYSAVPNEPAKPGAAPQTEAVVLRIEKSGRAGKTVTIVAGLRMHPAGKEALLRKLKTACGAGGALKDGELEVQGEQRAKIKALLEGMGYRVKGGV
jgi:translation initiation factor 1